MGIGKITNHRVTDPELIKTLNAMSGYYHDLDHLEGSSSSYQELSSHSEPGFLLKMVSVPYNLAIGAGGGIQNLRSWPVTLCDS